MKTRFKEELLQAFKSGYAVPAFNFDNIDMLKGIIAAAEEECSPVILMITESAAKALGIPLVMHLAKIIPKLSKVPTILHWDHGFSPDLIKKAIIAGFDSVMLDASKEVFTQNVAMTQEIVQFAHAHGVQVESEIGHVGGKEDDCNSINHEYTDIDEAQRFATATNVDALAIAVGTSHGLFSRKPVVIRFDIIEAVNSVVHVPLVLHGASDVPLEDLQTAIKCGIAKINIGTDVKIAYASALRQWLSENPDGYDSRKFSAMGIEAVKAEAKIKIRTFGSNNRVVLAEEESDF